MTEAQQREEWLREERDCDIHKLWVNALVNDNLEQGSLEWFLAWGYFKAGYLAAIGQEE